MNLRGIMLSEVSSSLKDNSVKLSNCLKMVKIVSKKTESSYILI